MSYTLTQHITVGDVESPVTVSDLYDISVVSRPGRDEVDVWRNELDEYYSVFRAFPTMSHDEILVRLASYSARASEIRSTLVRNENRAYTAFRTKEIDPFLTECDRQFKIWSRILSVRSFEFELSSKVGL